MGYYYVTTTGGEIRIPADKTAAAYAAVCKLNDRDDLKTGGAYGGEGVTADDPRPEGMDHHPARWFAWADPNYPAKCPTLRDVFCHIGFAAYVSLDDGATIIGDYDNKSGDEQLFLAAVAPFADEGSWLEWQGEDGAPYRHEVKGGRLHFRGALVEWGPLVPVMNGAAQ